MKRFFIVLTGLAVATLCIAANGISYDGSALTLNNDFTRTECGTMAKKTMKEVSGMAASRTIPGYLWAHGDENTGENKKIIAVQPSGTLAMTVNISGDPGRDDWEDIATGSYNATNYVFIGAFGDNDLAYNDQYYIYYFAEPAITSGTQTVTVSYIRFGYPDNQAHNTETLMYDNIENVLYISDKVDGGPCGLYKLPFRTDYGTGVQRLTKVCDLGSGSSFELVCGGDISPDGRWMAIKNQKYVLLWERQGSESLSQTVLRRPTQIAAYQKEEQGESLAWENSSTFYTTSDSKKDTPIYKYVKAVDHSVANVTGITIDGSPLADFQSGQTTYNITLAYGTTTIPFVAAAASDDGTISVVQANALPGSAVVTCMSNNGQNSVVYTINFTVSATPSTDATLKSLSINGTPINGFRPDSMSYSKEIAYIDPLPVITAEANDTHANVTVNNVTEVTAYGTAATVVVTAQDGTTQLVYTVTFHRAAAIKKIDEIILSNSYNAFIREGESVIRGWYLAGTDTPVIQSYKISEGASLVQSGNSVTLTGADGTTADYTLDIQPVTPVSFTEEEIVFNGSEDSWVKSAYGWADDKKWKFSKTDTDFSREIAGKTHVELFLPACDTVVLKSMSKERAVRFYVNGVQTGDKQTLLVAGNTLAVMQSAPFMLSVVSAQSSGDGGLSAIRMSRREKQTTATCQTYGGQEPAIRKMLVNGHIIIRCGENTYNILGQKSPDSFSK